VKVVEIRVDSELVDRCIRGDQTAWRALVLRYERLVYSVALAICPDTEDASDIFQQVWMELYQRLSDIRRVEALPAWLITVTRRHASKTIRSRAGSEPLDENLRDLRQQLGHIEREYALERALAQLSGRCRTLIDLLYFNIEEPSYAEIAKRLGIPVASVGPTRGRCLEKLRKVLG